MNLDYPKVLSDISDIIDSNVIPKGDFYDFVLEKMASIVDCNFLGLFFINAQNIQQKAFLSKTGSKYNDSISKNIFEKAINFKDRIFVLNENSKCYVIIKLTMKDSFFGFAVLNVKKEPTRHELEVLKTYGSVYSYVIKDFELASVFKMQLSSLQNAIQEKNAALAIIDKQRKRLLELDDTKNSFIANISHDLKTPLNAIIGFSQVLSSNLFGKLNKKQSEYINDIQISSLHLSNMLNEILNFAKIESKAMRLNLGIFSPNLIISEIITIMSPLSDKKSIEIAFEGGCKSDIKADCQKFQQIFYNLLSNAIKFTDTNGKIIVRTKEKNGKFILEVEDNGIGIEKQYHNKIFSKFVHLHNPDKVKEGSTGLGLAIAKEFVKLHKGKISLKSKPALGSVFKVELDCIVH